MFFTLIVQSAAGSSYVCFLIQNRFLLLQRNGLAMKSLALIIFRNLSSSSKLICQKTQPFARKTRTCKLAKCSGWQSFSFSNVFFTTSTATFVPLFLKQCRRSKKDFQLCLKDITKSGELVAFLTLFNRFGFTQTKSSYKEYGNRILEL